MSSTEHDPTPPRAVWPRLLIGLFGVAMFVVGLLVGNLALPLILGGAGDGGESNPTSIAQQFPATPTTAIIAEVATPTPAPPPTAPLPTAPPPAPTSTSPLPTTTPPPPPPTPLPPTATPTPTPAPTPTRNPSSVFAPEPTEATTAVATGIAPRIPTSTVSAFGTTTPRPVATATPTASAAPSPTPNLPFAATDRVNTELPVNFRAGPGTDFAAQGALSPGTLLAATGNARTIDGVPWREFRIANGTIGWVRAQDVIGAR